MNAGMEGNGVNITTVAYPNTIFAFFIAQNCELSARRGLWLKILEF